MQLPGNYTEVELSDGQPAQVRRLGIFELDQFRSEIPGPFTYKMKTLAGDEYDVIFDIARFEDPPKKPEFTDPPQEHSKEWYDLRTWELYQAATSYHEVAAKKRHHFYVRIIQHILSTCIDKDVIPRIVVYEDWKKVHGAALTPQLTRDHIENELRQTFQATYEDKEIFDALKELSGGHGMYDAIRLWENELMVKMRLTELEYALIPVEERARKVCAHILDDLLQSLEVDRVNKERNKTRGKG